MARIVVTKLLTTTCVCRSPPQVPFPTSLSFTQEVETALESFDFLDCADLDEEEEAAAKDEEQEQEDKEEVEEEKEGEEEEEKVKEENGQQEETENKMEDEIVAKEEKQEEKFYCGGRSVPRLSRLTRLLIVLPFN